jgi:probable rRNA maturation factor
MTVLAHRGASLVRLPEGNPSMSGMSRSIAIALSVTAGDWPPEAELARLAARAVEAVVGELALSVSGPCELSVVFTDDSHIAALNRQWRGKAKATNVLSFPAGMPAANGGLPTILGDIVLARETILREALVDEKPFNHHLTHLIVHGLLHLLGYDHEDDTEADRMEALEKRILSRLAIPDPYR